MKGVLTSLKKLTWCDWIFVLVLFLHVFVRFEAIEYPLLDAGDSSRDYMVAHLIASEGEFPLAGPTNGVFRSLKNSAFYYYLISLPLLVVDDPYTLSVVHHGIQTGTLLLLYLLARYMFGVYTALLAATLFATSYKFLFEQDYIWQPYVMVPVLYGGFFALAYAYRNKSHWSLVVGNILLALAVMLNNAALAFVPMYWVFSWMIGAKSGHMWGHRLAALLSGVATVLLLSISNVVHFLLHGGDRSHDLSVAADTVFGTIKIFMENIYTIIFILFRHFDIEFSETVFTLDHFFVLIFLVSATGYLCIKKTNEESWFVAASLSFLISLVGAVSVLGVLNIVGVPWSWHYLLAGYGIAIVLFAHMFWRTFFGTTWTSFVGVLVLIPIVAAGINYHYIRAQIFFDTSPSARQNIQVAYDAVFTEMKNIRERDGYDNYNFFHINGFQPGEYQIILLTWIERGIGEQLITIDDSEYSSLRQTNSNDYVFILCHHTEPHIYEYEKSLCSKNFTRRLGKSHLIEKSVIKAENFEILLAKKIISDR